MVAAMGYGGVLLAKSARINNCSGAQAGDYKTARAACKSGDFPGQTIVTCSNKGKLKDKRVCNSDGEKVGVYLGSCTGADTGFKDLMKACKSGDYFGEFLVKCRNGRQKKRMQCEAAAGGDSKVSIFRDRCGSGSSLAGNNLRKACKDNPGEFLVKCVKRKNAWKEKKSMHCHGNKDRFKFKHCSPNEKNTLLGDYDLAESRVDAVLAELETELRNPRMDRKLRNKLVRVRRKLEKIRTAMDRPRTIICKANKSVCKAANAFVGTGPNKINVCSDYFSKAGIVRASIIVHEIAHTDAGANDKGVDHGGCFSPTLANASSNFHRQAEYYEHIIECGLYVPN